MYIYSQTKFLGAFAKFLKATINFILPVCPSEWNISISHWGDFHEFINIWIFLENLSRILMIR